MTYELALIAVLIAGGYWGWYFVRDPRTRLYGTLMLASAALSGLGMLGRRAGEDAYGIPGAVGVGAGLCLLVLAPLARGAARRLAGSERFAGAKLLYDIAEVLAPGSGVDNEKELLAAMREIRDGNVEQAVDALTSARHTAPREAQLVIDERIAMLYLASSRWDEAIAYAEKHLLDAPAGEGAAGPGPTALRRLLGFAPAVWVELLGAYGYKGELDQAARMLARLEDVCEGRSDATMWLHRGRLIFLALAGRTAAVETLVEPRRSRHMTPASRIYWRAVAHERHGDREAAEAAYAKARSRSRGRPRQLIDQALERLASVTPAELGPIATEVVARVEAQPPPEVVERPRPRGPVATRVLTASIIATAIAVAVAFGSSADIGVLVRDGALVRGLVHAGQWWRLVTCIFVHVGGMHLLVNVVGLWMLGRLCEELFGSWRTAAVFALSGIGGSCASFFASAGGISAGASGAIFGLLGAVFVELTWHRKLHRLAWTRGVWGSLVVVAVAQLGTDFAFRITDHWAHAGGLAVGALCGFAFSPNARWHKLALYVARVVVVVFAAAVIVSFAFAARMSIADDLAASPQLGRDLIENDPIVTGGNLDAYMTGTAERAGQKGLEHVVVARDSVIPAPANCVTTELEGDVADDLGGRQRYRIVAAMCDGRVVTLYIPETVARAAPEYFTRLIMTL